MSQVAKGSVVEVHYTGTLDDGQVFDTSDGRDPLKFTVGSNEVIAGFDTAVMGMKVGDKKQVTLQPEKAYGPYDQSLVLEVPTERLPEDVKIGEQLAVEVGDRTFPFRLVELKEEKAILDGNHPLAGQSLTFAIELVGIG